MRFLGGSATLVAAEILKDAKNTAIKLTIQTINLIARTKNWSLRKHEKILQFFVKYKMQNNNTHRR